MSLTGTDGKPLADIRLPNGRLWYEDDDMKKHWTDKIPACKALSRSQRYNYRNRGRGPDSSTLQAVVDELDIQIIHRKGKDPMVIV